ncbi:MAG: PEP-CTERM sorting domain-containing protein, partial [Planctomycetota bacterium]
IDPDGLTDGGGTIGVNDLTAGPAEIQQQSLLISYHLGEPLSDVSKAKLLGILPYYATETLTDEDIIDLIDNPEFTDINDIRDAMVEDLALIYGEPTVDRAIFASQSLGLIANNPDVISRDTGYVADLNQIGDFNGDGGFDADDLDEFIADMNNGDEWTDLNGDGEFNDLDTVAYVSGFLSQLMGDANLDGTVDQADLNKVLNGWGDAGLGWADGNFGGQAAIDQFDLHAVLTNWGSTSAPDLQGFTVPEPAALTLIGLGGLALLCRRA